MPRGPSPSAPANCIRLERDARILELRKEGLTLTAIAQHADVKLSVGRVCEVLKALLAEARKHRLDLAEDLLDLELERLDRMHQSVYLGATNGDYEALDRLLKIHAARVKLLGLGAPTAVAVSNPEGGPVEMVAGFEIGELVARLPDALKQLGPDVARAVAQALAHSPSKDEG